MRCGLSGGDNQPDKRGVILSEEEILRVRTPNKGKGEIFGVVESMLGGSRTRVRCMDGKERIGRIVGKIRKRLWIREGDIVIIIPWEFQDEKGDVVWRYTRTEVDWLKRKGYV
jgi:translation initiation factor 1A